MPSVDAALLGQVLMAMVAILVAGLIIWQWVEKVRGQNEFDASCKNITRPVKPCKDAFGDKQVVFTEIGELKRRVTGLEANDRLILEKMEAGMKDLDHKLSEKTSGTHARIDSVGEKVAGLDGKITTFMDMIRGKL